MDELSISACSIARNVRYSARYGYVITNKMDIIQPCNNRLGARIQILLKSWRYLIVADIGGSFCLLTQMRMRNINERRIHTDKVGVAAEDTAWNDNTRMNEIQFKFMIQKRTGLLNSEL